MNRYFTQMLIGSVFFGFIIILLFYFNILDWRRDSVSKKYAKQTFHEIAVGQNAIIDIYNKQRIDSANKPFTNLDSMLSSFASFTKHVNFIKIPQLNIIDTAAKDSIKNILNSITTNLINNNHRHVLFNQNTLRKYRQGKTVKFYDSL